MFINKCIGCRNRKSTNEMVKGIRRKGVTTGTAEAMSLDLGSLNSIKEFANKVMNKDVTITVLINNGELC
jgi:short-subunit dehydrogenase